LGAQYSPISQKLFWDLYYKIGNDQTKFAELNKEYVLVQDKKCFAYDYVDMFRKKCIEFNGDFWHCNPLEYNEDYVHRVKGITALEIWNNDELKNELIQKMNYQVLIIWESEYRKNPEKTLQKCLDFINN
jgi:hypothetical protein